MKLSTREMQLNDIPKIVNYFVDADAEFLKGMGADKSKFPKRTDWINNLQKEYEKLYYEKKFYYIIWLINGKPSGHSNINTIDFGKTAVMHLHLWESNHRQKGLGLQFLQQTIPYYFENFDLEKLICEPRAENIAPNKTLKKLGFELVKTYETTPGWINFHQTVNRYELTKKQLNKIST